MVMVNFCYTARVITRGEIDVYKRVNETSPGFK